MRADSWNRALKHWIKVHNDLPRSAHQYSPNAIMDNTHQVDARYQYRFAYGDIDRLPPTDREGTTMEVRYQERTWILSRRQKGNEGRMQRVPAVLDVHRIRISEFELMEWYGKRVHVRQSGLSWGQVEEAMLDLLKDKPYMCASAPRPATEDPEQDSDDSDSDSAGEDDNREDMEQEQPPEPDYTGRLAP